MIERVIVYGLVDSRYPRTIRYVGMTGNLPSRLQSHRGHVEIYGNLGAWKDEMRRTAGWIDALVLSTHPSREAAEAAEWRTIARLRRRGFCDCNTMKASLSGAFAAMWTAKHARNAA